MGFNRKPGFNETVTPNIDALVASGTALTQQYVHKYCSPTRSSLQSGRLPIHVNVLNADMSSYNPNDPVSGFAGVPRNMTGISAVMKKGGYATHMVRLVSRRPPTLASLSPLPASLPSAARPRRPLPPLPPQNSTESGTPAWEAPITVRRL